MALGTTTSPLSLDTGRKHYVSPYGNDSLFRAYSRAYPARTIGKALLEAEAGDSVHVYPGGYAEVVDISLANGIPIFMEYGAVLDLDTDTAGEIPITDGGEATETVILGYGSFKRGGSPASGNNPVIALLDTASNLYIEGADFYNYCDTAQETEVFKVAGNATLKVKQTAPGLVQAATYDVLVGYDFEGLFDGEFLDLVQSAESIMEIGTVITPELAPRIRLKCKRTLSADQHAFDFLTIDAGQDIFLDVSEEIRQTGAFYCINFPADNGKFGVRCPLIISETGGDTAIVSGGDIFTIIGSQVVASGTDKPALNITVGLVRARGCNFFPTGTAKSVAGSGILEATGGCFATEDADTGGGVTLRGTLTKTTTLSVPT